MEIVLTCRGTRFSDTNSNMVLKQTNSQVFFFNRKKIYIRYKLESAKGRDTLERICNCKGSEEAYIVLRDTLTSQHQSIVVCITNPGISASFGVQNFYWGFFIYIVRDFPVGSDGKSICLQCRRSGFNPWVGKIPWRRKWQPTPVFLPEKSHGQRSLAGYSPWGLKESDMTERLSLHFTLSFYWLVHHLCEKILILTMTFRFQF